MALNTYTFPSFTTNKPMPPEEPLFFRVDGHPESGWGLGNLASQYSEMTSTVDLTPNELASPETKDYYPINIKFYKADNIYLPFYLKGRQLILKEIIQGV